MSKENFIGLTLQVSYRDSGLSPDYYRSRARVRLEKQYKTLCAYFEKPVLSTSELRAEIVVDTDRKGDTVLRHVFTQEIEIVEGSI